MSKWIDSRWYRVVGDGGELWCETSDRGEAEVAVKTCPYADVRFERMQVRTEERWVKVE